MSNAVCFGRVLTLNCACTGKRNGSSRKVVTRQSGQLPFALNAKFIFLLDKARRNSSQGWGFANTLTFAFMHHQGRSQDLLSGEAIPCRALCEWQKFC